ncbi:MAG TPA: hypothetical protein DCQ64_05040 [Candidatus Rokubacteria bacterium]|nr:hypothetical protein [Candidatus Rokubacteria bacterium]
MAELPVLTQQEQHERAQQRRDLLMPDFIRLVPAAEALRKLTSIPFVNPETGFPYGIRTILYDYEKLREELEEVAREDPERIRGFCTMTLKETIAAAWKQDDHNLILNSVRLLSSVWGLEKLRPEGKKGLQDAAEERRAVLEMREAMQRAGRITDEGDGGEPDGGA